jgi:hypothetical protein
MVGRRAVDGLLVTICSSHPAAVTIVGNNPLRRAVPVVLIAGRQKSHPAVSRAI